MEKKQADYPAMDFCRVTAREGAAKLVLHLLDELDKNSGRLDTPSDAEALHDFRVNLRRLRTFLKAYRGHMNPVPPVLVKKLKKMAAKTNSARDTEAGTLILKSLAGRLGGDDRASVFFIAGLLEKFCGHPRSGYIKKASVKFPDLAAVLREHVAGGTPARKSEKLKSRGNSLALLNGRLIRKYSLRLKTKLSRISCAGDMEKIHQARITAKRLRYILEPEAAASLEAGKIVKKIIRLQYLLGKMHDIHILYPVVKACAGGERKLVSGAEPAGLPSVRRAGKVAVSQLGSWEKSLFRLLKKDWLGKKPDLFFKRVLKYASR